MGKCRECPNDAGEMTRCPACRERAKGYARRYRERHAERKRLLEIERRRKKIENGICLDCPEKAIPGQRYCEGCSQRRARYYTIKHAGQKNRGECVACGNEVESERLPKTHCAACAKKAADRQKEIQQRRRAEGKCHLCEEPAAPDHALCPRHLERLREYARRSRTARKEFEESTESQES